MNRLPLAITMGDACGIGPEIVAQAFRRGSAHGAFVLGDVAVMRRAGGLHRRAAAGARRSTQPADALDCPPRSLPVLQPAGMPADLLDAPLGRPTPAPARRRRRRSVRRSGWRWPARWRRSSPRRCTRRRWPPPASGFPGHTELLQAGAGAGEVRMMLANDELRTVLVSIHMSLRAGDRRGDVRRRAADAAHRAPRRRAARLRRAPRIAVAGLNPHAGEGGLFGDEELRHHRAGHRRGARRGHRRAAARIAPDTVFMRARHAPPAHPGEFDVVVAMYHDQGLIPVKYLGVDEGRERDARACRWCAPAPTTARRSTSPAAAAPIRPASSRARVARRMAGG